MTVALALDLVRHVDRGEPLEDAARLAGIGPTTLGRWRAAGRAGDPRLVALVEALNRARRGGGRARPVRLARAERGSWIAPVAVGCLPELASGFGRSFAVFFAVPE